MTKTKVGRWMAPATVVILASCAQGEPPEAASGTEAAGGGETRSEVEVVAGEVLAASENQTFPSEDPRTGDLWFSVIGRSFDDQRIMLARRAAEGWAAPEAAPFSGEWGDRAPRFTPDGNALLFTSNRPRPGMDEAGDMNIWRVERGPDGAWSEPAMVETGVNSPEADIHVSVTASATWVASNRVGGLGRSDLYRVGHDGTVQHLPEPLNSDLSQPDVWVSPDESWMILAITDHPSGLGGDDLYVSRFDDGAWSEPVNLGPDINTPEYEYGPWVTADGTSLLFTSHRDGASNVYRVPIERVRERLPAVSGPVGS